MFKKVVFTIVGALFVGLIFLSFDYKSFSNQKGIDEERARIAQITQEKRAIEEKEKEIENQEKLAKATPPIINVDNFKAQQTVKFVTLNSPYGQDYPMTSLNYFFCVNSVDEAKNLSKAKFQTNAQDTDQMQVVENEKYYNISSPGMLFSFNFFRCNYFTLSEEYKIHTPLKKFGTLHKKPITKEVFKDFLEFMMPFYFSSDSFSEPAGSFVSENEKNIEYGIYVDNVSGGGDWGMCSKREVTRHVFVVEKTTGNISVKRELVAEFAGPCTGPAMVAPSETTNFKKLVYNSIYELLKHFDR